ncbi:MAG: hypothetical protein JRE92_00655, partial [Deltaproteobacteria bacterium]|nr:hypothetical protein [Deltaproteobacteria bacterium]
MKTRDKEEIRKAVRNNCGKTARLGKNLSDLNPASSCCGEQRIPDTKISPAS